MQKGDLVMFKVSLKGLNEAANELRSIVIQNKSELENLEDVISSLRGMSGMDGAVSLLRSNIDELISCQQSLISLYQALENISDIYLKTDRMISDYSEGSITKKNISKA